ncbi:MAG: patatin-like phospholipase family protein [Hyphomicrobiaceae bacterium]|nr:patatin-like phospholipase family protein [Hyphomicrobiaceae bacterium]
MTKATRRPVNLALQGGGAHGAFTWGVLDELLQDGGVSFGWMSATSAGAVNAAAVASGLATGGPPEAQKTLRKVWEAVEAAGVPDLLRFNPFFAGLAQGAPVPGMSGLLSPYDFNPLGFDPLRRLLTTHIDFERIRTSAPVELLIAATDVATGRARLFRRSELTVEAVLASACLPTLHHAVVIDGRAYWDGGFSANPDLLTLAAESPVEDTLIVQLNPLQHAGMPRSSREIAGRINAITFNQPLLRDAEAIVAARETRLGWLIGRRGRTARLKRHRFHLIEAGRYTAGLSADSKLKPDKGLLTYLHGAGRIETRKWLDRHRASLGRRSTVDLRSHYLDAAAPDLSEALTVVDPNPVVARL